MHFNKLTKQNIQNKTKILDNLFLIYKHNIKHYKILYISVKILHLIKIWGKWKKNKLNNIWK